MAHVWTAGGHEVTVYRATALPFEEDPGPYDGSLMAASIIYGRHQVSVREVARRWAARLNAMPSAFVSVCGALGGTSPDGPRHAAEYVENFVHETGWHPQRVISVAGALAYTRYGFITRWLMRWISKRIGRPTDTTCDYDFTDWGAVDAFAEQFAAALRRDAVSLAERA
jgi:menaquinone-dependent protoporphyrinogen oxidase